VPLLGLRVTLARPDLLRPQVRAILLVGLGVRELSVAPAAIPGIKATLAALALADCQAAAAKALAATGPEEARTIAVALVRG